MCPVYEYECKECNNKFDMYFPLREFDVVPECPDCGGSGKKIITVGGVQGDSPAWLNDPILQENLQGDNSRPIETRQEFKKYLKDNNLQQGTSPMF